MHNDPREGEFLEHDAHGWREQSAQSAQSSAGFQRPAGPHPAQSAARPHPQRTTQRGPQRGAGDPEQTPRWKSEIDTMLIPTAYEDERATRSVPQPSRSRGQREAVHGDASAPGVAEPADAQLGPARSQSRALIPVKAGGANERPPMIIPAGRTRAVAPRPPVVTARLHKTMMSPRWRRRLFAAVVALALFSALVPAVLLSRAGGGSSSAFATVGYSVDSGWLCYQWSTGLKHCTQHWKRQGENYISQNPGWVPSSSLTTAGYVLDAGAKAAPTATPVPTATVPSASSYITNGPVGPANTVGQPCHDSTMFPPNVNEWSVPPGCYGLIYTPNPADYPSRPGFGFCDWWAEVLHPSQPDILWGTEYKRGSVPVPGSVVFFDSNVQGAGPAGHFAQLVAVAPDHYWLLITEMNFAWRGGGFGKVDYRYVHVGSGVIFIYS